MNKSDLENDYALNEQRIIYLPDTVEEVALESVASQIYYLRAKDAGAPIHLHIRSNGGDSMTGQALVNVIQRDGNVYGWLMGGAASAAATIWASCAKRLVFASGRMGIHPVRWYEERVFFDAAKARSWAGQLTKADELQCEVYAAASNKAVSWWWERLNQPGDLKWLDARELICIGMAEKAEDQHV